MAYQVCLPRVKILFPYLQNKKILLKLKLCLLILQDKFKEWESSGVKIVPVLSQPDGNWSGETGYVQVHSYALLV